MSIDLPYTGSYTHIQCMGETFSWPPAWASHRQKALATGDMSHTLLPRFTIFSQGLIKVTSPIMLTLSVKARSLIWKGCAPHFLRWTFPFHSPRRLSLWAFQQAASTAMAPKLRSYSEGAPESSEKSWQSCFGQMETESTHSPLDIGVNKRRSFHLPHQSLGCLLFQMKGERALLPLLENGNVFALIHIITDPERIHVEVHS